MTPLSWFSLAVLVVSLGVNASGEEPGGPLRVTPDGLGATRQPSASPGPITSR